MRSLVLFMVLGLTSCSTCEVSTDPPGAKLEVDGEEVGKTPCSFRTNPFATSYGVKLTLDGYDAATREVYPQDPWYIAGIGGVSYPGLLHIKLGKFGGVATTTTLVCPTCGGRLASGVAICSGCGRKQ